MLKSELQDAVDFEIQLTKLLLKRSWAHDYTSMIVVSGKSDATVGGVIKLTDKWLESEDRSALSHDIKHQIAHLISGVSQKHSFAWQFIANKLYCKDELIKLKAKEVKECKYCGRFTVLLSSGLCNQCKTIKDAILLDENVAFKILHDIGAL